MDRRTFVATAGGATFTAATNLGALGQPAARRVGHLSGFRRADIDVLRVQLRTELERLGWTEGRNIVLLEPRTAEGRNELLQPMAAEVVAEGPDLILVQTVPATRALMQATKTIPIVMIGVGNPIEYGVVADYGKPGGNVTGSSYLADESAHKLLYLLKEAVPRLRSVVLFTNPSNEAAAALVKQTRADALALGMQAQIVEILGKGDLEAAFAAIRNAKTESILLPPEPLIRSLSGAISGFAQAHGLVLAVVGRALPAGVLVSFGPSFGQYPQITARYVDRILKGANPGDLPVEQPTRFELVIDLRAARALGLTMPPSLLARADEVIQ